MSLVADVAPNFPKAACILADQRDQLCETDPSNSLSVKIKKNWLTNINGKIASVNQRTTASFQNFCLDNRSASDYDYTFLPIFHIFYIFPSGYRIRIWISMNKKCVIQDIEENCSIPIADCNHPTCLLPIESLHLLEAWNDFFITKFWQNNDTIQFCSIKL